MEREFSTFTINTYKVVNVEQASEPGAKDYCIAFVHGSLDTYHLHNYLSMPCNL